MKAANPWMIGADPEFGILDRHNNLIIANLPNGKLGSDHGGRVVEIRPDPSTLASRVCADIFRTLNRRELIPYRVHRWKAGGMAGPQAIGGHIHFDVPWNGFDGSTTPAMQVNALDRMSEWFRALELFPDLECRSRISRGFGTPSSVRPSGRRPDGHARLEYRTPPSWLYSPDLTHLTLTAFKLAMVDPTSTLEALSTPSVRTAAKLRDFIRGFAQADDDAEEVSERMGTSRINLDQFRGDHNADIKEAWGIRTSESEAATIESPTPPHSALTQALIQYHSSEVVQALQSAYPAGMFRERSTP